MPPTKLLKEKNSKKYNLPNLCHKAKYSHASTGRLVKNFQKITRKFPKKKPTDTQVQQKTVGYLKACKFVSSQWDGRQHVSQSGLLYIFSLFP